MYIIGSINFQVSFGKDLYTSRSLQTGLSNLLKQSSFTGTYACMYIHIHLNVYILIYNRLDKLSGFLGNDLYTNRCL